MTGDERHADVLKRIAEDGTEYHCQAYGPDGGRLCFMAQYRPCSSRDMCELTMTRERLRLWVRLAALEQSGDPIATLLLDQVDSPQQLLNGDLDAERRRER